MSFLKNYKTKSNLNSFSLFKSRAEQIAQLNGSNYNITLEEVFIKYKDLYLPTLSHASAIKKIYRCSRYLKELFPVKMCDIDPELIGSYITYKKNNYKKEGTSIRYNFDKEIKDVRSIFSYWQDNFDFKFQNPMKKFHFSLGFLQEIPEKKKKMNPKEVKKFLDYLPSFYKDIAIMQFFMAARIGETAGILIKNIDLEKRILRIKEILIWVNGKPTVKSLPKNGKERNVYINDTMLSIIEKRLKNVPPNCPFLFHNEGEPLRYNRIRTNYRKAFLAANLPQFSGTHGLRHSMATITRNLTGSIDNVQAVTGHSSVKMAEHYTALSTVPLNQQSLIEVEKAMIIA